MSWTQVVLKLALVAMALTCRFFTPTRPSGTVDHLFHAVVLVTTFWTSWRQLLESLAGGLLAGQSTRMANVGGYMAGNVSMLTTLSACFWLGYRAYQTLRIPVPVLIETLRVEVPDAPDVSLAGIRADAATLEWSQPPANKPVHKFLIQVNGVIVGDSAPQETAITVTGLKPSHYYNVRVIAVGSNNYQVGSPVIRLQTYGAEGKPQVGTRTLPTSFTGITATASTPASLPTVSPIETTTSAPPPPPAQSRRRRSPSAAEPTARELADEEVLNELNTRFEQTRRDLAEAVAQTAQDEAELHAQEEALRSEIDARKAALREKEAASEQLRKTMKSTGDQMRAAEKERSKKEALLRERTDLLKKARERLATLQAEVRTMQEKRAQFDTEHEALDAFSQQKTAELRRENEVLQQQCAELETELNRKGKKLKALKGESHQLPGEHDEQDWLLEGEALQRQWDEVRARLEEQISDEAARGLELDNSLDLLAMRIQQQQQHLEAQFEHQQQFENQMLSSMYDSSGYHSPHLVPTSAPTRVRHAQSLSLSPTPYESNYEHTYPSHYASTATPIPSYLAIPSNYGYSSPESAALNDGIPLSPTATSLLPTGILGDDEGPLPPPYEQLGAPGPSRPAMTSHFSRRNPSPDSKPRHAVSQSEDIPRRRKTLFSRPPQTSSPSDSNTWRHLFTESPDSPSPRPVSMGESWRRIWSPPTESQQRWPTPPSPRRPSLSVMSPPAGNGSAALLETSLASADDAILDEAALRDPQVSPSQVGVIGSRASTFG